MYCLVTVASLVLLMSCAPTTQGQQGWFLLPAYYIKLHVECMHDIPNLTCYVYCVLLATSGVYLSLKGDYLANNSYVDVDDIGEQESALICHTNKTDCCRSDPIRAGEWYFPNGSRVQDGHWNQQFSGVNEYFYRNRGEKIVRLNRYGNSPLERGHFYCELPDANEIDKTLHVNISELY